MVATLEKPISNMAATGSTPGVLAPRSPLTIGMLTVGLFCFVHLTTAGRTDVALEGALVFLLPVLAVWCVAHSAAGTRWFRTALTSTVPPLDQSGIGWPCLGFVTVCVAITLLEWMQPLYFTQDDSLANGVVGMVMGGRALFAGEFWVWNHCQYLGAPMASMSYWSLTYPFTYLSYAVATYLMGNEWWTMEVYQVGHLLGSYFAIYAACRYAGLRKITAALAAVAVALSGSSLVMGRGWYATIPLNVWLPLMVIGICQIWRGPVTWRWTVTQGLMMGFLFHVGYPQTWVYAMMTFLGCIGLLWLLGEIPFRRAIHVIPAQLVGVAIACPLLFALSSELAESTVIGYGHGIGAGGFLAMILPYPLIQVAHPEKWGNSHTEMMGQMFYWGTLLPLISVSGVASLFALRHTTETVVRNFWLVIAAFWLAVSLGYRSVVWFFMGIAPGFANFSCPFKAQQMFNLFAAIGAGLIIDRLLRSSAMPPRSRARWDRVIAASVVCLTLYHCWMSRGSFHDYGYIPYPELPTAFDPVRESQQRAYVVAPLRLKSPTFPYSLQLSSATVYGIPAIGGYDPLVSYGAGTKEMLSNVDQLDDGWERYGVRWVVVHAAALSLTDEERQKPDRTKAHQRLARVAQVQAKLVQKQATVFYESPVVTIYELPHPDPMAFITESGKPLAISTDAGGLRIDTSTLADANNDSLITVNYARRPSIRGYAQGRSVPVTADKYHRIQVKVPDGCHELDIRYEPPWHFGFWAGSFLCLCAVMSYRFCADE